MKFKFNWIEKPTCDEKQQVLVTFDLVYHSKYSKNTKAGIYLFGTGISLKYKH